MADETYDETFEIQRHIKAIVALVAAVIVAVATPLGNGEIGDLSGGDWTGIVLTILGGAALVWFVENIQGVAGGIIKAVVAALTAAVVALQTGYLGDGAISQGELLTALGAFAATLAVTYQIPNAEPDRAAVVPTQEVRSEIPSPRAVR